MTVIGISDKYFNKDLPKTMVNTTATQNSSAFTGETQSTNWTISFH